MRRTRLILIPLVGCLLAGGGWWLLGTVGEPQYQGRSVVYWFREFCQAHGNGARTPRRYRKACDALQRMGTNAVPYLLNRAMNDEKDSAGRAALFDLLSLLPQSWSPPHYLTKEEIRQNAVQAIGQIGPPAGMVLGRLRKPLSEPNSVPFERAITVLERVGEGRQMLVPWFAAALRTTNLQTRLQAVWFLNQLGAQAAPAVPDLIRVLRSTERTSALFRQATFTLASIGRAAAPALPVLTEAYRTETNWDWKIPLATALCEIDPRQTEPFDLLVQVLTSQQSSTGQVRLAVSQLGWLGTNGGAFIPALAQAAERTDVDLLAISRCLDRLGAPRRLLLPRLRAGLKSVDPEYRVEVAARMLEVSPSDAEAQAVLSDQIRSHSKFEVEAICWLGEAGTNAQAAGHMVLEAFNGTNAQAWMALPRALQRMGLSPTPALSKLRARLKFADDKTRAAMAGTILRVEPDAEDARSALNDLIKGRSKQEFAAILFLGRTGPAASNSVPLLRQELKSQDPEIREAAAQAIERIERKTRRTPDSPES